MRLWALVLINLAFAALMGALSPHFLSAANLSVLLNNMAVEALALGPLALLMIAGQLDLSMDGTAALSGVVTGALLQAGVPVMVAIPAGLACGLAVGALNGLGITRLRLPSLICTLATWWITAGLALGVTKGMSPFGFPASFQAIGQGSFYGVRYSIMAGLACVALAEFVLQRTVFGAHLLVTGDNAEAGRMMGVKTQRIAFVMYLVSGLLAAVIGLVMASRLNAAAANVVDGLTLRVIAAVVIGGCSLSGGKGNVINGLLGLLLMDMLTNAAVLLGVSPYWQRSIIGGVLLLAIALDATGGTIKAPAWASILRPGGKR